jgi:hypothetical protein
LQLFSIPRKLIAKQVRQSQWYFGFSVSTDRYGVSVKSSSWVPYQDLPKLTKTLARTKREEGEKKRRFFVTDKRTKFVAVNTNAKGWTRYFQPGDIAHIVPLTIRFRRGLNPAI